MDAAQELLEAGAVGVLPTDTIYGLAARALDQKAVARLYALKNRRNKPGTVIASGLDQLIGLGLNARQLKEAERFWPGPVSVIIDCPSKNLEYLRVGSKSLAVRIPKDEKLRHVLEKTGPLLTTSANTPDDPPSNTIEEAKSYFGDKVDFYIDGGNLSSRKPSKIITINDLGQVTVLR